MAYLSPQSSSTGIAPKTSKSYVQPRPHSGEDLSDALGHIGVIEAPLSGFVSARFVINGRLRIFKDWAINFIPVDASKVPQDVLKALAAAS